jgi:putative tryptophan/tyrosine transport system substrate-binding protein
MRPESILRRAALAALWAASVSGAFAEPRPLAKKEYRVYIVIDTMRDKFVELKDGFTASLDRLLAAEGAKASYSLFDTKADKATAAGIVKAIRDGSPDLVAVINNSAVFADANVTLKLPESKYKFVSENCMPEQSGVAKSWVRPGGNVTGVGVFMPFAPLIKLAQRIRPSYDKVVSWTWAATKPVNAYLEPELARACKETGVELIGIERMSSIEEETEFCLDAQKYGPDCIAIPLISAWVHRDGTPLVSLDKVFEWYRKNITSLSLISWDESSVSAGFAYAGTCIIWGDLGAQMAEKSLAVLRGANPGDLGWDYPRKYNVMVNLAAARQNGVEIPPQLLDAAYRVFTDFDGNYIGKK